MHAAQLSSAQEGALASSTTESGPIISQSLGLDRLPNRVRVWIVSRANCCRGAVPQKPQGRSRPNCTLPYQTPNTTPSHRFFFSVPTSSPFPIVSITVRISSTQIQIIHRKANLIAPLLDKAQTPCRRKPLAILSLPLRLFCRVNSPPFPTKNPVASLTTPYATNRRQRCPR